MNERKKFTKTVSDWTIGVCWNIKNSCGSGMYMGDTHKNFDDVLGTKNVPRMVRTDRQTTETIHVNKNNKSSDYQAYSLVTI